MRNLFRTLLSLSVVVLCIGFFSNTVSAATLTITDEYGNDTTILSLDEKQLSPDIMPIGTGTINAPHPNTFINDIPGITDGEFATSSYFPYETAKLPDFTNFFLIDYGPNWKSLDGDAIGLNGVIQDLPGRYCYIYFGYPDTLSGDLSDLSSYQVFARCAPLNVGPGYTGIYTYEFSRGSDGDAYTPADNVLKVWGPFAYFFYNPDNSLMYLFESVYYESAGYAAYITVEGITSDNDTTNPNYYPRLVTFSNSEVNYIEAWASSMWLYDDVFDFSWLNDKPEIDDSVASDGDIWNAILDGNWTGDGWAGYLGKALQGIGSIIEFVKMTPTYFTAAANALPEPFTLFIVSCFSILFAVVVYKIAVHMIRG